MNDVLTERERRAYDAGFVAALKCFAWWKNGEQFVGQGTFTLNRAIDSMDTLSHYFPRIAENGSDG